MSHPLQISVLVLPLQGFVAFPNLQMFDQKKPKVGVDAAHFLFAYTLSSRGNDDVRSGGLKCPLGAWLRLFVKVAPGNSGMEYSSKSIVSAQVSALSVYTVQSISQFNPRSLIIGRKKIRPVLLLKAENSVQN